MAINLILKTKPILLRYAKQGMPGRTGPMGLPGEDAISWEVSVTMEGIPNGTCRIRLYKDGKQANEEIHFAAVYAMGTHRNAYELSDTYSHTISGSYTFQYTDTRAIFVIIYEDSYAEKVLTAGTATMIRGRDVKPLACAPLSFTTAEWVAKGASGASNVWTTGADYDNSELEDGDQVLIIGSVSDQLDQSDQPVQGMIIGTAVIPEGGSAAESVTVVSKAFMMGPCGPSATVQVGTVTTLPAGSQARVVNSGTRYNAIFDFFLPEGEAGSIANSLPFSAITGQPEDNANLDAALDGKVNKSGDTMSGPLDIQTNDIDSADESAPSANQYFVPVGIQDKNGKLLGYLQAARNTGGKNYLSIGARRVINSANKNAVINLFVDASGNASCSLPKVEAGTWEGSAIAIAHGGTGATTRLAALKALTQEDVGTDAQYFLTITKNWAKGGYTTVADAKTVLGLGGIQTRPNYSVSTTDLTAKSSELDTGKLYFVYE